MYYDDTITQGHYNYLKHADAMSDSEDPKSTETENDRNNYVSGYDTRLNDF